MASLAPARDTTAYETVGIRRATKVQDLWFLGGLILFATFLHLYVRLHSPHIIYADEIFQSIEPAYRLLYHKGIVPWEFQVGIRSWIFPGLLVPFLWLGRSFGPNPDQLLLPVYCFMALCSSIPTICSFLWGRRYFGLSGGMIAGTLSAIWVDNVYFSTHTLSEVMAANCLILALYLGTSSSTASLKRYFTSGLLFGITFVFRFHLGIAIAAALLIIGGRKDRSVWLSLAGGFLLPLCFSGILDWSTWSYPFQSVWLNLWLNVFKDVSSDYGHEPAWLFFAVPIYYWGGACTIVALTAAIGAVRQPALLIVSALVFFSMSLAPHKEYRFIYPAIPLLIASAGLGTAAIVDFVSRTFGKKLARRESLAMLALSFWAVTCLAICSSLNYQQLFTHGRASINAFERIAMDPEICGLAIYHYTGLPLGQSGLPPTVPMFDVDDAHFKRESAGFNAVLIQKGISLNHADFHKEDCWSDNGESSDKGYQTACLWVREGGCAPNIAHPFSPEWPHSWNDAFLPESILMKLRIWERQGRKTDFP